MYLEAPASSHTLHNYLKLEFQDTFMNKESSFEDIYSAYKNLVYNLALNYTQHSSDAEDITQDVFIKIYHQLHTHDETKASLKTWICRSAIHQCIDFARAKKTTKRSGFLLQLFKHQSNEPQYDPVGYHHPGMAAEDKEQLQSLLRMIHQLPENQKTVLILLKMEDLSQREVAEIMAVSVKAVESLLQRAKQSLEKKLKGSG